MADGNKFLHLGNSNDKILYDKFKAKLEKKDIATNNKLLQIFNFFDSCIIGCNDRGDNTLLVKIVFVIRRTGVTAVARSVATVAVVAASGDGKEHNESKHECKYFG